MSTNEQYQGCNEVLKYLNWYKQQIRQVDLNNEYLKNEYKKQNTLQTDEVEINGQKFDCTQCNYIGCCHAPPPDKKNLVQGCIKCLCQKKYTKCKPCIQFNSDDKCQPFSINNQLNTPYPKFQEYPPFNLNYQCVYCQQQINAIAGGDTKIDNVDQTMDCILNNTNLAKPQELDVVPPDVSIGKSSSITNQIDLFMSDKQNMIIVVASIIVCMFISAIFILFIAI
jgi:hypothetical protein